MCLSSPKAPKNPVAAAPVAKQDIMNDKGAQTAKFDERARLAKAAGRQSTMLTGDLGEAKTSRKALLGQ